MNPASHEIPGNAHAFEQLTKVLASGKAIAFVGAGASAGLYPLWPQLIRQLADAAVERGKAKETERKLWIDRWASTRPHQAVQGIKQALGEGMYCELLRETFAQKSSADGRPFTQVHELILQLPFRGCVTTNYDPALLSARQLTHPDRAVTGVGTWQDEATVHRWITGDIFDEETCPIMFLHGRHDDCVSIVLGAGEYRQAYTRGPFRKLLDKLWTQERLVFIGFGFSDAWMTFVVDDFLSDVGARTSSGPRHIAILGLAEGEEYSAELRRAEEDQYNACLLTYPIREAEDGGQDHGALVELLRNALSAISVEIDRQAIGRHKLTPEEPTFPSAYREWLERQCADIDQVGLKLKEVRPVKLNNVYVPLTTPAGHETSPEATAKARQGSANKKGRQQPETQESEPKSELLLNRLNDQSLYVSGAPGSGKSTFCRWVAWLACTGILPPEPDGDSPELREQFPNKLKGHLPILVRLRDFWKYLPEDAADEMSLTQLTQSLERWLADKRPGELNWSHIKPHLTQGTVLAIFDGVDEVPISHGPPEATRYPRMMLLSALAEAVTVWGGKGNRLLVTSRPYGLNDAERQKLGLPEARIEELPQPLQARLATRWFRILMDDLADGAAMAKGMLTDIQQRSGVDQLASNPMLLTAMCVIYREGKRLPEDKCDLYDRIVDNVLYNRVRDPAKIEMVRNELRVVAHGMHTGVAIGQQRTNPEAEVEWREVDCILETYRHESRWHQSGFEGAVASREYLLSHSGLLLPRSDRKAAFYHFSIQEFLAAERLADAPLEKWSDLFSQRSKVPEWHNTLSFVFGTIQRASVDRSVELLEHLLGAVGEDERGQQVVIGDALQMLLAKKIRLRPEKEGIFRDLCLSAIQCEVPLRERNLLGLALGHLGDPRIVEDLRDKAAYVEIPAGPYAYQDGRQTIDEPFWLAKYPVTNSQFALFIKDKGYTNHDLWSAEGWKWQEKEKAIQPRLWSNSKWNGPNQPVVGVSFYEAEAFCKWAGGFLPSEKQWEAAARGKSGHEYPWDGPWEDGICNSAEAGLKVTSPVGLFPRSKSVDFGLEDMAGNVWEWCQDEHERFGRVLRGGSFNSGARVVRAACRNRYRPGTRDNDNGFRVARTYR